MTVSEAFNLATQHHQAGRLRDAEVLYRQVLAGEPDHADARQFLGVIALQVGRHDLAVRWIGQAIALQPQNHHAHTNLGEAYRALGRFDEAVAAFRRALELQPASPDVHNNLGNALRDQGRLDEAVAAFRQALEFRPELPEAHNNLANALAEQGQLDEAADSYRRALQLKPDYAEAWNNLGTVLKNREKLDEALVSFRRAFEINPEYSEAHYNLGNTLVDQGAVGEAVAAYRHALRLKPDHRHARSNLIHALLYHPGREEKMLAEEQERWNLKFGEPLKCLIQPHGHDRNPDRRLRIGYISPDFSGHVVGRNLIPLFSNHDRREVEILCYSGVLHPDPWTEKFREWSDHWRKVVAVTDEALAEMIRQDGVDILVDLSQHTAGNRLALFAHQPAPVQVSFAGYPESAGVEAIQYRLSDRYLERKIGDGRSEIGADLRSPNFDLRPAERVFLLDSFWCYDPCDDVSVNPLPALENGHVNFGCLNNFCKINEPLLKLWARVLQEVKDSHLLLLSHSGSHRGRTLDILQREGIEAHRLEFVERRPRRAYLELYHGVDIALDPLPYNGHSTSLDALWMGVPLVSLAGEHPVSRAGYSQLSNLGLPELVAFSEHDYVRIAAQLAHDLPRLAQLRQTLRPRMEASPLMDAPRFARSIEAAYRTMWRQWCAGK